MRECRKCGKHIPYKTTINGQCKNLQSRKFCLECSPYKQHNTKSDDPSRPAKKKGPYSDWSETYKVKSRLSLFNRGTERKKTLVEMAGGKCCKCGYNNSYRALSFHHTNRSTKSFPLTKCNLWSKSWESILEEYNKCELLCLNCHAETEEQLHLNKIKSIDSKETS